MIPWDEKQLTSLCDMSKFDEVEFWDLCCFVDSIGTAGSMYSHCFYCCRKWESPCFIIIIHFHEISRKNRLHLKLMRQFDDWSIGKNTTVVLYNIMYITTVLFVSMTFIWVFGVILVENANFTRGFTHCVKMFHVKKDFWDNTVVDWQYYI